MNASYALSCLISLNTYSYYLSPIFFSLCTCNCIEHIRFCEKLKARGRAQHYPRKQVSHGTFKFDLNATNIGNHFHNTIAVLNEHKNSYIYMYIPRNIARCILLGWFQPRDACSKLSNHVGLLCLLLQRYETEGFVHVQCQEHVIQLAHLFCMRPFDAISLEKFDKHSVHFLFRKSFPGADTWAKGEWQ